MSHFAARPYLRFPVKMQRQPRLGRPFTPAFDLVADQISPSRIRCGATVAPSGQPAIARICCSNCETAQASMVQWPELCTRGAISLTSSLSPASSSTRNISAPSRRHNRDRPSCRISMPAPPRRSRRQSRPAPPIAQDAAPVMVFGDVVGSEVAVAGRAPHHRNLGRERHEGFEDGRRAPMPANAAAGSSPAAITAWPLPS